jgi:hypothetical protein
MPLCADFKLGQSQEWSHSFCDNYAELSDRFIRESQDFPSRASISPNAGRFGCRSHVSKSYEANTVFRHFFLPRRCVFSALNVRLCV